jgi:hypothetical protein
MLFVDCCLSEEHGVWRNDCGCIPVIYRTARPKVICIAEMSHKRKERMMDGAKSSVDWIANLQTLDRWQFSRPIIDFYMNIGLHPTPWSRELVVQLVEISASFYGTRKVINMFTKPTTGLYTESAKSTTSFEVQFIHTHITLTLNCRTFSLSIQ